MAMPLEIQITNQAVRCIEGDSSLEQFREWFVPASLDIEISGNPSAVALAHRIDGILAEASSAHWSDSEIVDALARIVGPFVLP
jgi:hypothetical protein